MPTYLSERFFFAVCDFEQLKKVGAISVTFRSPERSVAEYPWRVHDVGVFWDGETAYAIEDSCPHAFGFLHQGDIQRRKVICPVHAATFDLETGQCLDGFTRDTKAYATKVRDGRVWVHMPGEEPWERKPWERRWP